MKIFVIAKTGSKSHGLEQIDATHFVVSVKEPPKDGKANRAIEKALAAHFGVPFMNVWIISGKTSRNKVIEIK